jgi:hypothetical protein
MTYHKEGVEFDPPLLSPCGDSQAYLLVDQHDIYHNAEPEMKAPDPPNTAL